MGLRDYYVKCPGTKTIPLSSMGGRLGFGIVLEGALSDGLMLAVPTDPLESFHRVMTPPNILALARDGALAGHCHSLSCADLHYFRLYRLLLSK